MQKYYLHNYKVSSDEIEKKRTTILQKKQPTNVDINRLLNRVKVDQQSEKLKNFIFISLGILLLGLMGTFVLIVR